MDFAKFHVFIVTLPMGRPKLQRERLHQFWQHASLIPKPVLKNINAYLLALQVTQKRERSSPELLPDSVSLQAVPSRKVFIPPRRLDVSNSKTSCCVNTSVRQHNSLRSTTARTWVGGVRFTPKDTVKQPGIASLPADGSATGPRLKK